MKVISTNTSFFRSLTKILQQCITEGQH